MVDFTKIRISSAKKALNFGFKIPDHLPLLKSGKIVRSLDEVVNRALALNVIVYVSFGFPRLEAKLWIKQENLLSVFSDRELEFLEGASKQEKEKYQLHVEALTAFAWVLNFRKNLNFKSMAPNDLVFIFPQLKNAETSEKFRKKARLKNDDEIVSTCDLSYCLDWGYTDALINGTLNLPVRHYVIKERRRVLEWLLSRDNWDDIRLDT